MRLWVAAPDEYEIAEELMREYATWLPYDQAEMGVFEQEMSNIHSEYGPPLGLAILAALDDDPVGVAGVKRLTRATAELKRMWVRPAARGKGLGRQLATRAVGEARILGYRSVRLDTVGDVMAEANRLYDSMGFVEIDETSREHRESTRSMELDLDD